MTNCSTKSGATSSLPTTRTVDNHVALLRSKIEANPAAPRHLLTVFGVGYQWVD